jgi:predicted transcriptional regulator
MNDWRKPIDIYFEARSEHAQKLRDEGLSNQQIAARLGGTTQQVYRWLGQPKARVHLRSRYGLACGVNIVNVRSHMITDDSLQVTCLVCRRRIARYRAEDYDNLYRLARREHAFILSQYKLSHKEIGLRLGVSCAQASRLIYWYANSDNEDET